MYTATEKAKNRKALGKALVRAGAKTVFAPHFLGYKWNNEHTTLTLIGAPHTLSFVVSFHKDGASIKYARPISPTFLRLNYGEPMHEIARKLFVVLTRIQDRTGYW